MARPVILFSGQWADLPLEALAQKGQGALRPKGEGVGVFQEEVDPGPAHPKGLQGEGEAGLEEGEVLAQGSALQGHLRPFPGEEGPGGGQGLLRGEAHGKGGLGFPGGEGEVQGHPHLPHPKPRPEGGEGKGKGVGVLEGDPHGEEQGGLGGKL